jgi:hypothetical protein
MNDAKLRGAGGTPGGCGQFLLGLAMAIAGGFWMLQRVQVSGGSWSLWGYNAFGLTLVPLILGIVLVFWNGRSILGWLLVFAGAVILLAGVIANLQIYFQHTSLFELIVMLVLLFGGIGLLARAVRSAG